MKWSKLQFADDELEKLYQQYSLKLQWNAVVNAVTLVFAICGSMAAFSIGSGQTASPQSSFNLVACFVFAIILRSLKFHRIREENLHKLCYAMLLFAAAFCIVSMWTGISVNETEGVWEILFVIFLAFTMMPLKLLEAMLLGILLPVVQVASSGFHASRRNSRLSDYQQVNLSWVPPQFV